MPKSLEPNSRLVFVLACDADKPKETQPRIFGKSLTISGQRKLMGLLSKMQSGDRDAMIDAALDAAELCLTGWENMNGIEFSRDAIEQVLSLEELTEILSHVSDSGKASGEEQKKSE